MVICLALGLLAGLRAYLSALRELTQPRDFAQVWFAARALLGRHDPYALIGPGRAFDWPFPMFYPLPAAIAAIPLTPLPVEWAGAVFMMLAGAAFAWALMEHGYAPLIGFMGAAMVFASEMVQWSPLLAASLVIPPLAILAIAKPTIGAAIWLARPNWWAIGGAMLLGAAAWLVEPGWVSEWRSGFDPARFAPGRVFHFTAPVMQRGGVLVLLALTRWRRPEARLLAALACVPQTLLVYETCPLFLVPRTFKEASVLVVLSWIAQLAVMATTVNGSALTTGAPWVVLFLYLPATVMVLRRPNEGTLPARFERGIANWPAWLRGRPMALTTL